MSRRRPRRPPNLCLHPVQTHQEDSRTHSRDFVARHLVAGLDVTVARWDPQTRSVPEIVIRNLIIQALPVNLALRGSSLALMKPRRKIPRPKILPKVRPKNLSPRINPGIPPLKGKLPRLDVNPTHVRNDPSVRNKISLRIAPHEIVHATFPNFIRVLVSKSNASGAIWKRC